MPQLAGEFEGALGVGETESFDLLIRQGRGRQSINDAVIGVEPEYLRYLGHRAQHVGGADTEGSCRFGVLNEVNRQLLQLVLGAIEMEAQVLLQPQHILDQRGPFFFVLVAL